MKTNKGFSLVELIIVIAIMAILVGVMAPQLIKYIEKTNVSADTQLCDTVKSAITTAMMDPSVITANNNGIPKSDQASKVNQITGTSSFTDAVNEILGFEAKDINNHLKSSAKDNSGNVCFEIVGSNQVHVWVSKSDSTGKKGQHGLDSKPEDNCIFVD